MHGNVWLSVLSGMFQLYANVVCNLRKIKFPFLVSCLYHRRIFSIYRMKIGRAELLKRVADPIAEKMGLFEINVSPEVFYEANPQPIPFPASIRFEVSQQPRFAPPANLEVRF